MKKSVLILIGLCFGVYVFGQNLVLNPSFEELGNLPVRPNPKNTFEYEPSSGYQPFQKNLKYWFAGSRTTPDLRIHHSKSYADCNRSYNDCDKARTGNIMVGIITYMANTYTDTYREYIQTKFWRALKPGVKTHFEFYVVKERQAKLVSNNIGIHFSTKKIYEQTEGVLDLKPQFNCDTLLNVNGQAWVKISGAFTPARAYEYILIGNFFHNVKTDTARYEKYTGSPYTPPYAYYLIDDIRVWQEGDSTSAPTFSPEKLAVNEKLVLKNIFFETDKAILKDTSFVELEKVYNFLKDNPKVKIAILGHTDDQGEDDYNQHLSERRAKAVYHYLVARDIQEERLKFEGYGEKMPVAENTSPEGRQLNRRVEMKILEK